MSRRHKALNRDFPGALTGLPQIYAICIPSQVSGVDPKAFDNRMAISTEIPV